MKLYTPQPAGGAERLPALQLQQPGPRLLHHPGNPIQQQATNWAQGPKIKGLSTQPTLDPDPLQVSFGPFTSPEKLITLVNIVDHYRLILSAMPFVSVDTRLKAMKALQDFSTTDVANANAGSTAVVGVWGPDMT